ncbi:MAG TPA: RNA methyltransferase [Candidatus Thermoplasmatota archaeon]|nr:RNA methyltransferase [Candidatus Thermoplasmatota archaeon]
MRDTLAGRHAVMAALRGKRDVHSVLAARDADRDLVRDLQALCARRGLTLRFVGREELAGLVGSSRNQGVGAIVGPLPETTLRDVVREAREAGEAALLVALDGVEDPQNVGAAARSALLAGAHALILPDRGTAALGPGAHKAASGALATLPVLREANLRTALETLKREGVWIVGADAGGGKPPWQLDLRRDVCLVLGAEHEGLSRQALEAVDAKVRIPTPGGDLSLNVSAATAVLAFEAVRQRST